MISVSRGSIVARLSSLQSLRRRNCSLGRPRSRRSRIFLTQTAPAPTSALYSAGLTDETRYTLGMEFKSQAFTVSDLYNWYRSGELFLQPKFQRRKIWKPIAKSYLIDTLLRGLPMPKIYYRMQVNPSTVKSVREIVDGQQRLDAIFGYVDNQFAVRKSHGEAGGKRFRDLDPDVQNRILYYDVAADLLIGADDAQVLQIFARINSYSLTLNAQEKRNAKYFGLFKEAAYRLGTTHVAFWTNRRILTDANIARMAEAELSSELLVGLIAGLQDKKKSLNKYYEQYEDVFPNQRAIELQFERTLSWLDEQVGSYLAKTAFSRRTLFYSLFMATSDALFGIPKGHGPLSIVARKPLSKAQGNELRRRLTEITDGLRAAKPPRNLAKFAIASAGQTDNVKPRQTRHDYLLGILKAL